MYVYTHKYIHMYTYIPAYIYIHTHILSVCVCVCVCIHIFFRYWAISRKLQILFSLLPNHFYKSQGDTETLQYGWFPKLCTC